MAVAHPCAPPQVTAGPLWAVEINRPVIVLSVAGFRPSDRAQSIWKVQDTQTDPSGRRNPAASTSGLVSGLRWSVARPGSGLLGLGSVFAFGFGDPADLLPGQADDRADGLSWRFPGDERGDLPVTFGAEGFELPVPAHDRPELREVIGHEINSSTRECGIVGVAHCHVNVAYLGHADRA